MDIVLTFYSMDEFGIELVDHDPEVKHYIEYGCLNEDIEAALCGYEDMAQVISEHGQAQVTLKDVYVNSELGGWTDIGYEVSSVFLDWNEMEVSAIEEHQEDISPEADYCFVASLYEDACKYIDRAVKEALQRWEDEGDEQ